MVWVYVALVIVVLLGLFAHLLKFQVALQWHSPIDLKITAVVSFLWMQRDFTFDRIGRAKETDKHFGDGATEVTAGKKFGNQGGFLRIPESFALRFASFQKHLQRSLVKLALDLKVWRVLFRYLYKSGLRVLRLLHPSLDYLHIGMEDVMSLGIFAAVWSSLCGIFPSLASSVEYHFNQRPGSISFGLKGGFTGWNALVFGLMVLVSFPWIPIGSRFLSCWRNPQLNRWQRRLLLF